MKRLEEIKQKNISTCGVALLAQIRAGNIEQIEELIGNSSYVETFSFCEDGIYPLSLAVHMNRLDIARLLLRVGANPACLDKNGRTLLMRLTLTPRMPSFPSTAASREKEAQRMQYVKLLADHHDRSHFLLIDKDGATALILACVSGKDEDVRLILESCRAVDAALAAATPAPAMSAPSAGSARGKGGGGGGGENRGRGAGAEKPGAATDSAPPPPVSFTSLVVDKKQVSSYPHRGKPSSRAKFADSALLLMARRRNLNLVKMLTSLGAADVNAFGTDGMTALMWAAWAGDRPLVAHLLRDCGALPNLRSEAGKTALFWALDNNQFEAATMLLKFGFEDDSDYLDYWPWPPPPPLPRDALGEGAEGAEGRLHSDALVLRPSATSTTTTAPTPTPTGAHEIQREVFRANSCDPNIATVDGATPLLVLCRVFAPLNAPGATYLEEKARNDMFMGLFALLLERGALHSANVRSRDGFTPIMWAVMHNRQALVMSMLAHDDFDPTLTDANGRDAMQLAEDVSLRMLIAEAITRRKRK